jgi:hypothetical protein
VGLAGPPYSRGDAEHDQQNDEERQYAADHVATRLGRPLHP